MRTRPIFVRRQYVRELLVSQWEIIERKYSAGQLDYGSYLKAKEKMRRLGLRGGSH